MKGEMRMAIDIEDVVERAIEQAFVKAFDQYLQTKSLELFKKLLEEDSPLARKLGDKIEQGFQRFLEEGIRWERKGAGFKPGRKSHP